MGDSTATARRDKRIDDATVVRRDRRRDSTRLFRDRPIANSAQGRAANHIAA